DHPCAASSECDAAFGIGNRQWKGRGDFTVLEIDTADGLIAAVRYPKTACASGQAGARILTDLHLLDDLVGFGVDASDDVLRKMRNPDRLVDDHPVGGFGHVEGCVGNQLGETECAEPAWHWTCPARGPRRRGEGSASASRPRFPSPIRS